MEVCMTKICTDCKTSLPFANFCKHPETKDKKAPQCRACKRNSVLIIRYNITQAVYSEMLAEQSGSCKICQKPAKTSRGLFVDHCHKTGKVRGLLCATCNTALGKFDDNPEVALRAVEYLVTQGRISSKTY